MIWKYKQSNDLTGRKEAAWEGRIRIAIRVDANAEIAMGHLMRCLSVAEELERRGAEVVFFVSEEEAGRVLAERGRRHVCLKGSYKEKERELPALLQLLGEYGASCVLLDSYEVTPAYMRALQDRAPLVYLDDLNAFCYPADVVVNYTTGIRKTAYTKKFRGYEGWECESEIGAEQGSRSNKSQDWAERNSESEDGTVRSCGSSASCDCTDLDGMHSAKFLLGSRYVPLRAEFSAERIPIRERIEAILITSGGADGCDMLRGAAGCLSRERFPGVRKHIVAGRFCGHLRELEEMAEEDESIVVHRDVQNMAELMRKCDLAVSAGGTTLAELCACGIPTVCYASADNQLAGLRAYGEAGLALYAGDVREDREAVLESIARSAERLAGEPVLRGRLGAAAKAAIDGRGAGRIAEAILSVAELYSDRYCK
ncbi:MAG: DUF354 domain-containing protein [Lachnospiraceae bacterium]|nr:DUF354 domain-containing protein [Lachnospiraceae bacterium]